MEKSEMSVQGMTCMGCVNNVRQLLQALAGVKKVDVSLEGGKVIVEFDATQIKLNELKSAIEEAGYDVAARL